MGAMRVLLADDELVARKRLTRLLAAIDDVTVVGECDSGAAVLERVRVKEADVDLVLLDIQMPNLSGLETMALLPEDGPLVVLCTAHPDHAVDAFEHGAVDYILKPVEPARLKKALARAAARLAERSERSPLAPAREGPDAPVFERLPIRTRQGIVLVDPKTVSHAVLEGELVTVVADGGTYLSESTLNELQERLPRETFERVHRRALLNLEHVVRLEPLETGGSSRTRAAAGPSRSRARRRGSSASASGFAEPAVHLTGDLLEDVEVDRLDEVVIEPRLGRAAHVVVLPVARQRDQGGAMVPGRAEAGRDRVAIHAGQPDVEEHEIGGHGGRRRERGGAVVRNRHLVSEHLEHVTYGVRGVLVVVDHEHAQRTAHGSRGGRRLAVRRLVRPTTRAGASRRTRCRAPGRR